MNVNFDNSLNPLISLEYTSKDKQDMKDHSGQIWNCVGKYKTSNNGHIYEFVVREEYNDLKINPQIKTRIWQGQKKSDEIFPAIEPLPSKIWYLCTDRQIIDIVFGANIFSRYGQFQPDGHTPIEDLDLEILSLEWDVYHNWASFLKELGYVVWLSDGQLKLLIPDLEELNARWKRLQDLHPKLPDLDIVATEGIVDDLSLAEVYRDHDSLLSSGNEFIHDHFVHIFPMIARMLHGKKRYRKEKKHIINVITQIQNISKEALRREGEDGILHKNKEILNFIVGMLTDSYFSISDAKEIAKINLKEAETTLLFEAQEGQKHPWDNYLKKRFGSDVDHHTIAKLWREVRRLVPSKRRVEES